MKLKKYFIVFVAFLFMIIGVNSVGAYSSLLYLNTYEAMQISFLIDDNSDFILSDEAFNEDLIYVQDGVVTLFYDNNSLGSYDLKNKVLVMSIYKFRLDEGDDPQTDVYVKYTWYAPNDYYNSSEGLSLLNYYDASTGYFSTLFVQGNSSNYPINCNYFIQQYDDFRNDTDVSINRDSIGYINKNIDNFGIDDYDSVYNSGYSEGYQVGFDEGVVSVELGSDLQNFGSFGRILLDSVGNFLSFEIVPNFSLLNVLQLVMTICLVILFLKFFAGG